MPVTQASEQSQRQMTAADFSFAIPPSSPPFSFTQPQLRPPFCPFPRFAFFFLADTVGRTGVHTWPNQVQKIRRRVQYSKSDPFLTFIAEKFSDNSNDHIETRFGYGSS